MKKVNLILYFILIFMMITGCSGQAKNPELVITFKDFGTVEMELYPDKAPNTVNNIIKLVNDGYYQDGAVYKVVPEKLIVFGNLANLTNGGIHYTIEGEFAENGFDGNDLPFVRGTVVMYRDEDSRDSASSSVMILLDDAPELEGRYAAIGIVTKGLDNLEGMNSIKNMKESGDYQPVFCPKIEQAYVKLHGVTYPLPKTIWAGAQD